MQTPGPGSFDFMQSMGAKEQLGSKGLKKWKNIEELLNFIKQTLSFITSKGVKLTTLITVHSLDVNFIGMQFQF